MLTSLRLIVLCSLVLLLGGACGGASGADAPGPEPGPDPQLRPTGLSPLYRHIGSVAPRHARDIGGSNWSVGGETLDRDYSVFRHWAPYLGPLGAKKVRLQSGWAKTETAPGVYDWAWLDEAVEGVVAQGVEPWLSLSYGNPLYPGGGETGLGGSLPTDPKALAAWTRYVAAAVDRYAEHVDEWEVWNEPHVETDEGADVYTKLFIATAEVIKQHQPDATVIGLALAGTESRDDHAVRRVLSRLQDAGKLDLLDRVSYHPYTYNPDTAYGAVGEMRRAIQGFDTRIRLLQGENGAPSERGGFGALGDNDWTQASQAKWALRRMLGDLARDVPSSIFTLVDLEYPNRRNHKGLLEIHDDQTVAGKKAGYFAVQHLTAIFDDTLQRIADFESTPAADFTTLTVAGYERADGLRAVTWWLRGETPGDGREVETRDFRVTGDGFEDPVLVDLLSGSVWEVDPAAWSVVDGETRFEALPVYDSPFALLDRSMVPLQ